MVSPLVSCEWLKEQLEKNAPDLRVLDGKLHARAAATACRGGLSHFIYQYHYN